MTYSYTKNREKQEEKIWTKTRKQHRGRKAQTPKCDGSKSPSFSLCSFLTTTVNAQILDSCSTRIRKEKNNCQDKLNASLTDRTFTFIHETTTATVSKHGAFTVRWMLLDHRSQTAQHHLTCFFSHFPPPRLLHHILKMTNPLACALSDPRTPWSITGIILPSFFAIVLYWMHAVFVGTDILLSHWSAVVPFLPYGPPPTEHCEQLLLWNHNTCCHLDGDFDKDMFLSNWCSVCISSNNTWNSRLLSLPWDRSE